MVRKLYLRPTLGGLIEGSYAQSQQGIGRPISNLVVQIPQATIPEGESSIPTLEVAAELNRAAADVEQVKVDVAQALENVNAATGNIQAAVDAANAATAAVDAMQGDVDAAKTAADQASADVEAAKSDVEAAKQAAADASAQVASKNSVTYSNNMPVGDGKVLGDVHYTLDPMGNIMTQYVWTGSAWSAKTITASMIQSLSAGQITTGYLDAARIQSESISAAKLAANSVTADKIEANAVTAAKIAASAVVADKIAADAVTADKIQANAITADKLAAGAVVAGKIQAGAVDADAIAANAVTASKIEAGAVIAEKIQSGAVIAEKIGALAVTADKISASAVTADKIAANAVIANKIAADAINGKTITGATVQTAASGARTVLGTTGMQVINSSGQTLVQVGAGVTNGMAMRAPTGDLVPIGDGVFGTRTVTEPRICSRGYSPGSVFTIKAGDANTSIPSIRVRPWTPQVLVRFGMLGYSYNVTANIKLTARLWVNGVAATTRDYGNSSNVNYGAASATIYSGDWDAEFGNTSVFNVTPGSSYTFTFRIDVSVLSGAGAPGWLDMLQSFITVEQAMSG